MFMPENGVLNRRKLMPIKAVEEISEGIRTLKTEGFEKPMIELLERLLLFHINLKRMAENYIDFSRVFKQDIKKSIKKGRNVANLSNLKIERGFLIDAFEGICEIGKSYSEEKIEQINAIQRAVRDGEIDVGKIQRGFFLKGRYFDITSKKLNVPRELLFSVSLNVYRPLFEVCTKSMQNTVENLLWLEGYCPICGIFPGMARLEAETGKRILWCPICGMEWTYRRIKCPFCENDDHESLRYFYLDEKSPYRVDVCDNCKGYIKTIDERKRERRIPLLLEDIKTVYLDSIAEKEGFRKIKGVETQTKWRCWDEDLSKNFP